MFYNTGMKICAFCSVIVFVLFSVFCLQAQERNAVVAGSFYPANALRLKSEVEGFVEKASISGEVLSKSDLIGFVAPHAGYAYSGAVAGHSYKLLKGKEYDTVIILGPNHRAVGFKDVSVWSKRQFKTPLGSILIDEEMAEAIIGYDSKKFVSYPEAHKMEHSIEVQLPFLQVLLKEFKIVPIVLGDYSSDVCKRLSEAIIKSSKGKKVLVVASSDFSHDKTYEKAVEMDKYGIDYIRKVDINGLIQANNQGKTEMCGYGPVLVLMNYVKELGTKEGVFLEYKNSGDVTGNKNSRIVGYGAVAFFKGQKEGDKMNEPYTIDEKKLLLKLARNSISSSLGGVKEEVEKVSKFKENRGVFVTLHKKGNLRGCIGYIEPIKSLYDAVKDNAINAALKDYRFSTLKKSELEDVDIEISVLTPPVEVSGASEFIVGKHGIIIKKGFNQAVFLPQVAPEQGWTREETLSHLCVKAGLSADSWKQSGMEFFVFEAIVFGEKELEEK